jgi:hypothetical protein
MEKTTSTIYDTDEKYENEFSNNLKDCKSEFISLFADKGGDENDIVSVCAPGN